MHFIWHKLVEAHSACVGCMRSLNCQLRFHSPKLPGDFELWVIKRWAPCIPICRLARQKHETDFRICPISSQYDLPESMIIERQRVSLRAYAQTLSAGSMDYEYDGRSMTERKFPSRINARLGFSIGECPHHAAGHLQVHLGSAWQAASSPCTAVIQEAQVCRHTKTPMLLRK